MTLREAFMQLYSEHGFLSPKLVVDQARDGTDAVAERLREALPWDKDEALYQYQLAVAQKHIQRFRCAYQPTPRSTLREIRQWISVPDAKTGRSYKPIQEVAADPVASRVVLQEAERAWRELKARYGHIREFIDLVQRDLEQDAA